MQPVPLLFSRCRRFCDCSNLLVALTLLAIIHVRRFDEKRATKTTSAGYNSISDFINTPGFLNERCSPTPPLNQHLAQSEQIVLTLG